MFIVRLRQNLYRTNKSIYEFARLWPQPCRQDGMGWYVGVHKVIGPIYRKVGSPTLRRDSKMEKVCTQTTP